MERVVLFLRKKIEGQNSMEELANSLKSAMPEIEILELPYYSTSLIGMFKNGLYARKHQGSVNHIFSITEGYLSLFLSGKKIITVHDLYFRHFSIINRIAIRLLWILFPSFFTNEYTCISSNTLNRLLKILPWIKKKCKLIYNPINDVFFQSYECKNNTIPIVLHIGTALHKNLLKVIKSLSGIKCKLVIIGRLFPDQQECLKKYSIDYENEYDISTKNLLDFYRRADIISFPSSQEGFGMIVVEANAVGKPVIAGDIPVLHEIGGDAALYVNPNDISSIRTGFINIMENHDIRTHCIQQGYINANRFRLKNVAAQYRNLYYN